MATPSGSSATLQWNDNATNESGYRVYLAVGNGAFSRLSPDLAAGSRGATLSSLAAGSYRVYVVAFNSAGESAPSNTANVTIATSTTAAFSVSPSAGVAGVTTFVFTNTSSGATSWLWNFGDGAHIVVAESDARLRIAGDVHDPAHGQRSGGQSFASHAVSVIFGNRRRLYVLAVESDDAAERRFLRPLVGQCRSWHWNFGDGSSSTLAESVEALLIRRHLLGVADGVDAAGLTSTISHTITVTYGHSGRAAGCRPRSI